MQELSHRRALATGKDQPVEADKVLGESDLSRRDAERIEHADVFGEVTLNGEDADRLLADASLALRQAQHNGRNRVVEFMLLDRLFPRSAFYSLRLAEHSLDELMKSKPDRVGPGAEARRLLGSPAELAASGLLTEREIALLGTDPLSGIPTPRRAHADVTEIPLMLAVQAKRADAVTLLRKG